MALLQTVGATRVAAATTAATAAAANQLEKPQSLTAAMLHAAVPHVGHQK
jgi:hypothetical protein